MQVLWITSSLPYPPVTGAKIRMWNLLKCAARHHHITLLSLVDQADELQFLPYLQCCVKVETVVKQRRRNRGKLFFRLLRTLLKEQPARNGIAYYEDMQRKVREITSRYTFDIINIEQSHMAPYIEFVANADQVRLITLYDVGATQQERVLRIQAGLPSRWGIWLDAFLLRRWEPAYLARHFDKCIVVSPADEALLRQANPALELAVVPNGVDTTQYGLLADAPDSKDILFVGKMNYAPNVDGVRFFCQEVFPLVKQQVPEARLLIVGQDPVAALRAMASDDVTVTGSVESIIPYYQQSCMSIVPLRAGSGTRLKILESMALGRPVVSTTIGCEGLAVTPEENILVADGPADLARQVIRLLSDQDLRRRIIAGGRQLVEMTYDWQVIAERLLQIYAQAVSGRRL
jgi:sugar transferase (PEP-CTERM/EpsH1 system associated)